MKSKETPAAPVVPLFRVSRYPDPLAWPLPEHSGLNRFDDREGRFQVLYAAEQRVACFIETLAYLRPSVRALTLARALPSDPEASPGVAVGVVPSDWLETRRIGSFTVADGQRWLDLRSLATRRLLREELAGRWLAFDLDDFDLGDLLTRRRDISQTIAGWAFDRGYQGIVYPSRFDARLSCWAIFSGAEITPLANEVIAADDPDLLAALQALGLRLG